jgi:hypothetical protein
MGLLIESYGVATTQMSSDAKDEFGKISWPPATGCTSPALSTVQISSVAKFPVRPGITSSDSGPTPRTQIATCAILLRSSVIPDLVIVLIMGRVKRQQVPQGRLDFGFEFGF